MTDDADHFPDRSPRNPRKRGGLLARILQLPGQSVYSKALTLFVVFSILLGAAVVILTAEIILREFKETERQEMIGSLQKRQYNKKRRIS